jgi:hypothetical protein
VDVVTGVEASPGVKDHAKVEAFLAAAGAETPEARKEREQSEREVKRKERKEREKAAPR